MIELINDTLIFTFPAVHPKAQLEITFKRTLRIPSSNDAFPLPPQRGNFPVVHVDDYKDNIPTKWLQHGGVMLPMHQSEALWIYFRSRYLEAHSHEYPFAVKIATGKINAISGKPWEQTLTAKPQNYVVIPEQSRIDGYCTDKGEIRQFIALPLGEGSTVEEQITSQSTHGGFQIQVFPMRREAFEQRFPVRKKADKVTDEASCTSSFALIHKTAMGIAPGGRIKQKIYKDPYSLTDWDLTQTSRCFVHITNSAHWQTITGQFPPTKAASATDYLNSGLPWFDYYAEGNKETKALSGSKVLAALKSIMSPDTAKTDPTNIRIGKRSVRECGTK